MKLLRYAFFPIPEPGSNGHLCQFDTYNGDGNCLVCPVFSFGLDGCFFAIGNLFDNRLINDHLTHRYKPAASSSNSA